MSFVGILLLLALVAVPGVRASGSYTWADDSSLSGNSATTGLLWKSVAASADGEHLVAVEQPNFFSFGGGDIWTSANGGVTWIDASLLAGNSGTSNRQWTSVASSANGQKLIASAESGGVWRSVDGGTTWTDVANFTMSGGIWKAVTISADGTYMHAMPARGDVWSSSDGGDTWRNDTWLTGNGSTHQNWQAVASSADGQTVVGGVSGGDIWTTTDDGTTWIDNSQLPANTAMAGKFWQSLAMSANGQHILAVVSNGDIWTSENSGATWTDNSLSNAGTSSQQWVAAAASADGHNLAAAISGGGVWVSNDSGTTWVDSTVATPFDSLEWTGLAANITSGKLITVEDGFSAGGDIYSAINTALPQTINTTINNPVTLAILTINTPVNTALTCSSTVAEASLSKQDTSYDYPLGLVNLCYVTLLPSDPVSLTFITDLTPSQVVARDFNTASGTYAAIAGAAIIQTTLSGHPALQLTYTIADNGVLDSNPASNFVSDPVGLAVLPTVAAHAITAPDAGFGMPPPRASSTEVSALGAFLITSSGIVLLHRQKFRRHV